MTTGIRTRPSTKEYRNNFDQVFKQKKKDKPKKETKEERAMKAMYSLQGK
jgi:hypothetical protein